MGAQSVDLGQIFVKVSSARCASTRKVRPMLLVIRIRSSDCGIGLLGAYGYAATMHLRYSRALRIIYRPHTFESAREFRHISLQVLFVEGRTVRIHQVPHQGHEKRSVHHHDTDPAAVSTYIVDVTKCTCGYKTYDVLGRSNSFARVAWLQACYDHGPCDRRCGFARGACSVRVRQG